MDVHTKEQRSRNMRAIRNRDTKIEIILGKKMWSRGIRYRKNSKYIFGKPDFSIKKYKIAIFCDSEFFHGKDWETSKNRIKTNREFWQKKIESNIRRDKLVNETLEKEGWKVIRFWGNEIKQNLNNCLEIIEKSINEQKSS